MIVDFIAWNSPISSLISIALSTRTARDNAFNRDATSLSSSDPLRFYSGAKVRGYAHLFKHDADAHVAVELIEKAKILLSVGSWFSTEPDFLVLERLADMDPKRHSSTVEPFSAMLLSM